jgi:hypothetical protein
MWLKSQPGVTDSCYPRVEVTAHVDPGSLHPTHARHGIHQAAAEIPPSATPARKPKKKLMRLLQKDRSQLYRGFQGAFLLLNLALGAKFYYWVRQLETGTTSLHRPPGVEG